MIECSGICYFGTAEAVTGRLCGVKKANGCMGDSARILLWNGKDELSDTLLSCAVGMVFPNDIPESSVRDALRLAHFCRLPALCVDSPSMLSLDGIAILDSAHSKLYVNPDLETINSYFGAHTRSKIRHTTRAMLETDSVLNIADTPYSGVVAIKQEHTEEQVYYERLCELADTNTGAELVAFASAADTDNFISDVRAIYRAGVWGRVSLLCSSLCTPDRALEHVLLLHKVFCMLEDEGREFNGFISKGLLIDTPLLLNCAPRHNIIDFFCLDFERLRRLLTANDVKSVGESDTARYIEEFAKKAHGARISLRGTENVSKQVMTEILETVSPYSIYKNKQENF